MTHTHKSAFCRLIAVLIPLLFLCADACVSAAEKPASAAPCTIQQLTMEFRHPVTDGTLMRMIWQIDGPAKDALTADEIAERGLHPNDIIPCLAEFVAMEFTNGRRRDLRERYIPWTPALEARLHAVIAAQTLAAENDYGARAEAVVNPAYNILIACTDGRSLHITSEGTTVTDHEAVIEDALLTWCDEAFGTESKQH